MKVIAAALVAATFVLTNVVLAHAAPVVTSRSNKKAGIAANPGSGAAKAGVGQKRTGGTDNNNPLPRDRSKLRLEAVGSSLKKN